MSQWRPAEAKRGQMRPDEARGMCQPVEARGGQERPGEARSASGGQWRPRRPGEARIG